MKYNNYTVLLHHSTGYRDPALLAHELGHNLFLYHPWENSYCNSSDYLNDVFGNKCPLSRITSYNVCYTKLLRTNGKMNWGGTWQTKNATFIAVSPNRGPQTIKENFPEGIKNAVLVHDCWKPHFKTGTQSHQLCLPDMFRELKYMGERFRHSWPTEVRKVFNDAINLKKRFKRYDYVPKQAIQIPTIHLSILISP